MEMIDSGSLAVILPVNSTGMCFVSGQENPESDFHLYVLQWMLNSASFGFNLFLFFLNMLLEALQVYSNLWSPGWGNLCQFGLNIYSKYYEPRKCSQWFSRLPSVEQILVSLENPVKREISLHRAVFSLCPQPSVIVPTRFKNLSWRVRCL